MASTKQVTHDFLDSAQYLTKSILLYEKVYGEDFVSPGGKVMATEMISRMALAPESRVLDVGCGLGGSAFAMATEYGLHVDGIDLSKNMLAIANSKLETYGLSQQVNFKWQDCLEITRVDYYDAVYSRDVFLHIHNKTRLFSVLEASLHPAGKLLFTDYCCGLKPWGDDFSEYVKDRGYCLHHPEDYANLISQAGFEQVTFEDISAKFIQILQADIEKIATLDPAKNDLVKLVGAGSCAEQPQEIIVGACLPRLKETDLWLGKPVELTCL